MRPDTRKILTSGTITFAVGLVGALLAVTVFGGIGRQGPHTNLGWLMLMIAMGCLPTGFLTLLLAAAKLRVDRRR